MMTARIKASDQHIEQIARTKYPETELLQQVSGVGPLISLTYVLTVDDPRRFAKSRDALRPKRGDSSERKPQLRITKEGDIYPRKLLVQGSQHILHHGPDTDLKRWGRKLAERGGGMPRSGRWWRWRGSWPSCCIVCWSRAKCMSRCATARPSYAASKPSLNGVLVFANRRVRVTARSRCNERNRKRRRSVRHGDGSPQSMIEDPKRHRSAMLH